MASYEDTVIALGPVFFARLDELAGSVITDISGNGNHGTYSGTQTFGLPSPIETDAASTSVGGAVGSVPAAAASDLDLLDNQTWLGWIYYDDALADTMHLLGRSQQFGQSNG